ncbi:YfcZ/YiiS family protein [Pasteurella atlantica]|uniref:YfcZ/YiiS family protein n=2 Tax=Pasteurellaceae TaxID=712 RepID=A0ACC6HMW0_9PAST|nr:YfcZ/YiiS family protein [Pasteurella atlantica]MDP8033222.1 YfcZ/YiiS family protein [Pasteurella atlantica]MDP8035228.1 YfcZ/YiiS family protein [Pasteurella atlantica]MDP8037178.1 YfcZ/YiiS family protein [Pasteurella atlantica]MDP8047365.1 YfcZ/YiiS family protein [Pasteurella atlantica]MDP8049411.1 YfcZ/YiiS family protein [Pasteurella atlantica]
MSECEANESKVCCCVDVGTVIDGEDRSVDFVQVYATQSQAEDALAYLTEKAKTAESEPCQINSKITQVENGYELKADFEFCCQAEAMIFQLSTR